MFHLMFHIMVIGPRQIFFCVPHPRPKQKRTLVHTACTHTHKHLDTHAQPTTVRTAIAVAIGTTWIFNVTHASERQHGDVDYPNDYLVTLSTPM